MSKWLASTPDFKLGLTNNFRYKDFHWVFFGIDTRRDIYSVTINQLLGRGVTKIQEIVKEHIIPKREIRIT
jgi:hypothetical protein